MLMFLQAVGEAVVAKGLGALKGFVPFGNVLFDVGADALDRYRKFRRESKLAEDVEAALRAEMKDLRAEAERIIRDAAQGEPDEIIDLAVAYLTQMPGAIRQSLKRADDPTGTTLPPALNLQDPIQLSALLPRRLPTFRTGDAVPHAPQWRFVELLGAGGFGEVWLAKHAYLDDLRAIKFCLDPASRNRLLTHEKDVVRRVMKASAAASDGDHGIVRLLDCYLEPDGPWLAYEYVDGGDLTAWARANALLAPPLRAANALGIVRDLAGVVGHFHALPQPVIHRDLKPANVLLRKVNGRWLLRVTDFGIGHVGAAAGLARATISTPSMSLGDTFRGAHTPNYASPQQKRGEPADPRDDVHALGVIALQLLLGDLSAERPSGNSWKKKLKDCEVAPETLDLLARCWEDDPDERPKDGRELLSSLAPRSPGGRGAGGEGELGPAVLPPNSNPTPRKVQCPNPACGKTVRYYPASAGKIKACPTCQHKMLLPKDNEPQIALPQSSEPDVAPPSPKPSAPPPKPPIAPAVVPAPPKASTAPQRQQNLRKLLLAGKGTPAERMEYLALRGDKSNESPFLADSIFLDIAWSSLFIASLVLIVLSFCGYGLPYLGIPTWMTAIIAFLASGMLISNFSNRPIPPTWREFGPCPPDCPKDITQARKWLGLPEQK